ncbi:hypothetical protein [Mangrovimonas sp. YM274]|uniref:hypothetical protein n=1 Tax=Mangrovimonas sp. YM274 TaxID=3070660 RepID=UPI0027DE778C|nr:hypothetical protein [Mangrovimonas sp. YM274]WMI69004.1 hypothetical protein RBH95_01220 [Mangrovimonas sp. YM274]
MNIPKSGLNQTISKSFYLICTIILFTSCSSDSAEDSIPISNNIEVDILGTWYLIQHSSSNSIAQTGTTITSAGSDYNYTIEFTDNPKYINTNGNYTVNMTETTSDNESSNYTYMVNSNETQQEGFHIGEWSIVDGNLITRVYDNDPFGPGSYEQTTEILELTTNKLVLKTDDSPSSSENYTVTGNTTLVYER